MRKCKKCGNRVDKKIKFCTQCGNKIKNNKLPIVMLIFILLLLVLLLLNKYTNLLNYNKYLKNDDIKYENAYEHIVYDYKNKNIDENEYFRELYYLEFDSSSLDSKYKKDSSDFFVTSDELGTIGFLSDNYKKIDKDLINNYLNKKLLTDVDFKSSQNISKTNSSFIKLSNDNKDEDDPVINHTFNKVKLSSNEHFMIWYTDDMNSNDYVTNDQIDNILSKLESSISKIEEKYNISYSYTPYSGLNLDYINKDYTNLKKVMEENNISTDYINKAMSIYVYDTGSENTLATYFGGNSLLELLDLTLPGLELLSEDGIINYPYIVVNKKTINNSESLNQVMVHELFHHFEHLYFNLNNKTWGKNKEDAFVESYSNYVSSTLDNYNSSNNYLNRWANVYYENSSDNFDEISDNGGSSGYALFPYMYSYSLIVDNSSDIFNKAMLKDDSWKYINENTSKENLKDTMNDLAYRLLSQDYDNSSLKKTTGEISYKDDISSKKYYFEKINRGAVDYYLLDKYTTLNVSADDYSYLSFMIVGKKNNNYDVIKKVSNKFSYNVHDLYDYDKVFLIVTNGNLKEKYNYKINVLESKTESEEYVATYNNYNIEIISKLSINSASVITTSKGVMDELHQKEYIEVSTDTLGANVTTNKMYIDYGSGYSYTSVSLPIPNYENVWYKGEVSTEKFDLGLVLDKLKNEEDIQKISDDHFKVKLSKKELTKIMNATSSKNMKILKGTEIDVYTSGDDIQTIKYDFSNIIPGIDEFSTTVNFSNYNNAGDVEIPNEIIDSAIEK